jgi:heterodisulfide reductase subunit A
VKQAIELKQVLPDADVFSFYMDLRMFGRHFEDIYKEAQIEHNVQFIRGRLSEAFENSDGSILLKVEDTLLNKPLKLSVDLVVLMVGMEPSKTSRSLCEKIGLSNNGDGFFNQDDPHFASSKTSVPGIFVAGACSGPKTMEATLNEARSAAFQIAEFLK